MFIGVLLSELESLKEYLMQFLEVYFELENKSYKQFNQLVSFLGGWVRSWFYI